MKCSHAVRQKFARILTEEYGYSSQELMSVVTIMNKMESSFIEVIYAVLKEFNLQIKEEPHRISNIKQLQGVRDILQNNHQVQKSSDPKIKLILAHISVNKIDVDSFVDALFDFVYYCYANQDEKMEIDGMGRIQIYHAYKENVIMVEPESELDDVEYESVQRIDDNQQAYINGIASNDVLTNQASAENVDFDWTRYYQNTQEFDESAE